MSVRDIFSERLAQLRISYKLTQSELGDSVHYSQQTISDLERAEYYPCAEFLVAIAKKYHVSVDWLLGLKS